MKRVCAFGGLKSHAVHVANGRTRAVHVDYCCSSDTCCVRTWRCFFVVVGNQDASRLFTCARKFHIIIPRSDAEAGVARNDEAEKERNSLRASDPSRDKQVLVGVRNCALLCKRSKGKLSRPRAHVVTNNNTTK